MTEDTQQAAGPGEWTLLAIGYKRRDVSARAHRVGDGGRTFCGYRVDDRAIPIPPGSTPRRCILCSLSEA